MNKDINCQVRQPPSHLASKRLRIETASTTKSYFCHYPTRYQRCFHPEETVFPFKSYSCLHTNHRNALRRTHDILSRLRTRFPRTNPVHRTWISSLVQILRSPNRVSHTTSKLPMQQVSPLHNQYLLYLVSRLHNTTKRLRNADARRRSE